MSGLTSLCISCLSFTVARWGQSWVECAFKAGRRWEGGTIHVCSFALMAEALPEAITSWLSLRSLGQKGSHGHADWGETGKIRNWIVRTELEQPLEATRNHSSQIGTWIHVPGLKPRETRGLPAETTHPVSGPTEAQVLNVSSQKELRDRLGDR